VISFNEWLFDFHTIYNSLFNSSLRHINYKILFQYMEIKMKFSPKCLFTIFVAMASIFPNGVTQAQSIRAASNTPVIGKLNQTYSVVLEEKQRQDFNLDLPKGEFFVYCDGATINDSPRIFGSIELLKRNGAQMPEYTGALKFWAQNEKVWREGAKFRLKAPTGIRLRLKNTGSETNNYWVKVVPVTPQSQFVPFGFKIPVTAAKIGPNNGAGGTLAPSQVVFQRVTLPAGKWSYSLGAKGMPSNFDGIISNADETGSEVRKEKIIRLTKPTTLIFRVWNEGESISYPTKYDVTIEPAT
jgi:hypothetical protein